MHAAAVVSPHVLYGMEVVLGTIFFSLLFYLSVAFLKRYKTRPIWNGRLLTDNDCYDISIKIVTSLFSVMNCSAASIAIARLRHADIMEDKFWLIPAWVYFGVGYYIFDTAMKPYCFGLDAGLSGGWAAFVGFTRSQPLMMLHHVITLAVYYPTLMWFRNGKGDFLVACFFLMDLAVPFIQVRHIMYRLGMSALPLYLWNGIVLVVAFFISRIWMLYYICSTYASYRRLSITAAMSQLPCVCTIGMLSMLLMQAYWFCMMARKLAKFVGSHGKAE